MPRFRRPLSPVHTARRAAAVLLAALAMVLALRPVPRTAVGEAPPDEPATVAAADLPPGAVLTAADLSLARFPPDLTPAGVAADPADLVGRTLAGPVRAGEPVTDVRLVGAGLTDLLPDGQVAAPVRLADLAVAALVHEGDRVDVLATPPEATTAEVVADSALVLATPGGADPDGGLLLLAVDATTAARLAAASAMATLTVTLPPP
jgi:pilus assembly protein CpaB